MSIGTPQQYQSAILCGETVLVKVTWPTDFQCMTGE